MILVLIAVYPPCLLGLSLLFLSLPIWAAASQVACMQFINIVVHSVEDMNFRVHLQYEFTKLGLEEFLQVSRVLGQKTSLTVSQRYFFYKSLVRDAPRALPVFCGLGLRPS